MTLLPQLDGEIPINSSKKQFAIALKERVARGFLTGRQATRQRYELIDTDSDACIVRATNWPTAINVGMNHLSLKCTGNGTLRYHLTYWRWTAYCAGLGASLGLAMIVLFLAIDIRQYIANNPRARIPGLTIDQHVYFVWANILFWGFLWPWVLVAMHKRPLRNLLTNTIFEIDHKATSKAQNA